MVSMLYAQAVNFASYDTFKLLLKGSDPTVELSKFKGFVAGAMAGVTAITSIESESTPQIDVVLS